MEPWRGLIDAASSRTRRARCCARAADPRVGRSHDGAAGLRRAASAAGGGARRVVCARRGTTGARRSAHHPRIGDRDRSAAPIRRDATSVRAGTGRRRRRRGGRARRRSRSERRVRARFGYIFIVCATGASARRRCWRCCARGSTTTPDDEIRIAAAEQAKITDLRLLGR